MTQIAYLDCSSGISGDMTVAALVDAGAPWEVLQNAIAALGIPGIELRIKSVQRAGFAAPHFTVEHPDQHAHRRHAEIDQLIANAPLQPRAKLWARQIFQAVAVAEAKVHGVEVADVHFHEVGAIDSIVDIVAAAVGFDCLNVDQILCSRLPTGRGRVKIAHGICPLPAPATAELLIGIPLDDVAIESELTTPTGAAIVKTLVDKFGPLPAMTIRAIGRGAGSKEFAERPNILRLFLGNLEPSPHTDRVTVLETNLDDVSPEIVGYTRARLFAAGALDVYSIPIQMKKDRSGTMLCVICQSQDVEKLESILFQETATFGVRRSTWDRSVRSRESTTVQTPWGAVTGKVGWRAGESKLFTPEFESCARLAAERDIPLREVYRAACAAFTAIEDKPAEEHHGHDHDHSHSHDHGHDHDHSHDHGHDDHGHRPPPPPPPPPQGPRN